VFKKLKRRELMAIVIVLTLCIALPILAMATGSATVTVGSTSTAAKPGDTVTIPVSISGNPGIFGYGLTISYDSTNLTLNSITNTDNDNNTVDLCTSGMFNPNTDITSVGADKAKVTWVNGNTDTTGDGNLFYLNFTVKSTVVTGNYPVTCALTNGYESNFANYAGQNVAVSFIDGNIEVSTPDMTAPVMTKLTATIGGTDIDCTDGNLSCAVGDTVTAIKVAMSEPVSFVESASTNVTMSGDTIPAGTVYGTLSLDASDATNKTLIITPNSGNETAGLEGIFNFTVAAGTIQDAAGNGNVATTFTLTVANPEIPEDFTIDLADFCGGIYNIAKGGEYQLATDAAGTIQITTTEPVTITGNGTSGTANSGLSIDYTIAGARLTIDDIYITGAVAGSGMIEFTGADNKLLLSGDSILQRTGSVWGNALIHVPATADLTINGTGVVYLAQDGDGAAIGGNPSEINGNITIDGGEIFCRSNKTGSSIGGGQSANGGNTTINGGELNIFHNARGAMLGGGGYNNSIVGLGGTVTMTGGNVSLFVNFTGAAIGGGGGSNSALEQAGGDLYITGGSLKTYINSNALSSWGLTTAGVTPIIITADKSIGASGTAVHLLTMDVSGIAANATGDAYVAYLDNNATDPIYAGGLHGYAYTGTGTNAMTYWQTSTTDTNLYLYVTGENHTLTINDKKYDATWDSATSSFSVKEAEESTVWDGTADTSWYDAENPQTSYTITKAKQLAGLASLVNAGNSFSGVTFTLANDIDLNKDGSTNNWTPIGTASITIDANRHAVVNSETPFAGIFDGDGHAINGLYISSAANVQGLFGDITGTVENLTVNGSVNSTAAVATEYKMICVGGVTAFNNGGTMTNVINNATVNAPAIYFVGGIAGYNYNGGTITRSINKAAVTGYQAVGGIAGENGGIITYCCNTAQVDAINNSSKNGVGGIAGKNGNHYTAIETGVVDSCYNLGTVGRAGQKWVGGIAGFQNSKSSTKNCYNVGTVVVGAGRYAAIIGQEEGTSSNNYSLNTQANDTNQTVIGTQLTDAQMKTAANLLGGAFVNDTADGYPVLFWQKGLNLGTITVDSSISNGTVSAFAQAAEGNLVTITVTPDSGYMLTADSLTYTVSGHDPVAITATDGVYSFVMPAANVNITASFALPAGTQANPYKIKTADDLAALATYTNAGNPTKGLYWELENDIDLSSVCGPTIGSWTPIGALTITSSFTVEGYPFLGNFNGNGHKIENLYISANANGLGLFGMIGGTDTPGAAGYGVVTNFKLYGSINNTSTTNEETDWCGAVCGKLNAGGTISYIVNYAAVNAKCTDNVGGIVGFAGTPIKVHASDDSSRYTSNPSGYNTFVLCCGNQAQICGYYKLGGIVGENAATVMYCYNTGYILPHMHGSGGGWGGIAGRNGNNNTATEESVVAYCYNTGKITNNGMNDDENETIKGYAGIAGMTYGGKGHNTVYNCYNIGAIPCGRNNYGSITNNLEYSIPNSVVYNNYSLDTPLINNYSTELWKTGTIISDTAFKATTYGDSDILTCLGTAFTADTTNINGGYPILRWQVGAAIPTLSSISIATPPTKVAYDDTEVFNPAGMVVLGTYSDGSKAVINGYTYSTAPLTVGMTGVDISYGGFTVTQPITVSSLSLTGIAITTKPTNLVYAADETFDPTGMVVTATYNNNTATNKAIAYDATGAAGYTYSVDASGLVTVSYVEGGITQTTTLQLTSLTSNVPATVNSIYQLDSADDMLWFTNQVNVLGKTTLNAELLNDIDLSEVSWTSIGTSTKAYSGEFDGNGNTVTFNNTFTANYAGTFGYIGSTTVDSTTYTASIHDLKAAGTITAIGRNYVAGIAGYVAAGNLTNCTNNAAVTAGSNTAGIAGYTVSAGSITNCENKGVITATSSYSGGITGYAYNTIIANCTNSGNIVGANTTGGIVGGASSPSISNCSNSGTVTGSNNVGGICGNLSATTNEIQYCSNTGSVTGTSSAVGGILGSGNGTIDNSYNTAAIQGTYYVGGIVGQNSAVNVSNSYNTGAIKGTSGTSIWLASGGICGTSGSGVSFTNCYNSGKVTATYAGALVGTSNNVVFTLSNCYYLNGTASVAYNERTAGKVVATNVSAKTAAELKALAATLGASYKVGGISPILTWQADEIFSSNTPVINGSTETAEMPDTIIIGANSNVEFNALAETGVALTRANIYIPYNVVGELGNAQSLTINTNMGTVTFDSEALADIVQNATGSILLTLNQTSNADGVTVFELTLQDYAGHDVFTDGSATVTLPYTLAEGQSPDAVKVFYLAGNGTKVEVDCTYADGYVTFTVEHFSTYSIEADSTAISAVSATTDVNAGETFDVAVKVYGAEGQQFASMSANLNYDDSKVEYVGFTAGAGTSDASAYDNKTTNKINILESGADKTIGADGFTIGTVTFKALTGIAAGNSVASFAISDGTVGQSGTPTPAVSAVSSVDLAVNLHNLTVKFQQGTGNTVTTVTAYAKYNAAGLYTSNAYTDAFTIPEPVAAAGYRLADKVWSDGSNSYTAAEVAELTFADNATMTAQSIKTYNVSFYNSDATQIGSTQTVDTGLSATAPANPTAPAGMSFAGWFVAATADASYDGSATLYSKAQVDAEAVTADTIFKAYYTDNEYSITVPQEVTIVSGVTSCMAKHGTDVVFTANLDASGTYAYVVSYKIGTADAVILTADTNNQYTIPGSAITDAVVVSIQQTVNGSVSYITYDEYKGAPVDYKVALLKLNGTAPAGCKYQYDGQDMFYAQPVNTEAAYGTGAYVFFVAADEDLLTTLSKIEIVSGTQLTIDYDGNVNGLSGVEINDAQLVYDLYNNNANYQTNFNFATMLMRFEADVNGDGTIGVNDIRMIYSIIRGITE